MKQLTRIMITAGMVSLLLITACYKNRYTRTIPEKISNEVILKWNEVAYEIMRGNTKQHTSFSPGIYATMHIAMHDAVNAVLPRFESYVYHVRETCADPEVAAASAAHRVLKVLFPEKSAFLDSVMAGYLSKFLENEARTKGIHIGIEAANATLSLSNNVDGDIGESTKLFSLQRKDQFRCVQPPALNSSAYAVAFNEVKDIGYVNSITRAPDQSAQASYWYENAEDGWNRIARIVATERKADLLTSARLFALLNIAIADANTVSWDSKLRYNLGRPYTAIRNASSDGNSSTAENAKWLPAETTPATFEYPSTHSTIGNAGAMVLAYFFGDKTGFTMSSPTAFAAGPSRSFRSFSQAADENSRSRVMAGINFSFSCEAGQELGDKIGKWTIENNMKPL